MSIAASFSSWSASRASILATFCSKATMILLSMIETKESADDVVSKGEEEVGD